jgi:hypothetical protein
MFKTLGVHIRGSDHSQEVPAVHLDSYLKLLRNSKDFDKFFIATDDNRVLNYLIKEFGEDRLIYQNAVRSDSLEGVHTDFSFKDRYRLGLEVLADCYALSVCRKTLLVHSNVSYGALLLNPELPYQLLETKGSLFKRWKTTIIYLLDRWSMRRM